MFTMIFVIVFVLALPGNVTMFTNEARGTSVSGEEIWKMKISGMTA